MKSELQEGRDLRSEWASACVLKWTKKRGRVGERASNAGWREGGGHNYRHERNQTTQVSSQGDLGLQSLVEKSGVALVFPLLPRASGEAGPGRPAGTGAVAWDTVLAVRQWPSNQLNTTRVSLGARGSALNASLDLNLRLIFFFLVARNNMVSMFGFV